MFYINLAPSAVVKRQIKSFEQLSNWSLKQLLQKFKNIKRCLVIHFIVSVFLWVTDPTFSLWHFKAGTVYDLTFDASSCGNPPFQTWFTHTEFHNIPPVC